MINVHAVNEVNDVLTLDFKVLEDCCRGILKDYQHKQGDVTYIFTNDETLRKLKKQFFNVDVFTDVIAFNLEEKGEHLEGEVYISWERTRENATSFQQDPARELKRMVIHGSLHLIGLDDKTEDEKKEMTRLEDHYIARFPTDIIK